jgi:hypothetical protein
MAEKPRSRSETVRLWIDAIGIPVVLALLGLWQFWLKEVRWPAQAPVNLTAELSVKDAGKGAFSSESSQANSDLQAIELEVTARNPSSRAICLLDNLWIAYGVKISSPDRKDWLEAMETEINGNHQIIGGAHYGAGHPVPVAAGNVFTDSGLQPNEKIVRTFVFYVPRGSYDYVEVDVGLPTVAKERSDSPGEGAAKVTYQLRDDHSSFRPSVSLLRTDGKELSAPDAKQLKDYGFQWAISTRMLSLWEKLPPPPGGATP